jgi:hypothetical protein
VGSESKYSTGKEGEVSHFLEQKNLPTGNHGTTLRASMKKLITILSVAAVALAMSTSAFAADKAKKKKRDPKAPVTITGVGVCAKCALGEAKECANVIKVTRKNKDGKETTRIITVADNAVAKAAHGKFFCKGETPVSVTGTIKREGKGKDAKTVLTATAVGEPKKKKSKKKKDA